MIIQNRGSPCPKAKNITICFKLTWFLDFWLYVFWGYLGLGAIIALYLGMHGLKEVIFFTLTYGKFDKKKKQKKLF